MPAFTLSSFSHRFREQTGTVQLMEDLGAARDFPGPVCMLGGGNPAHIPEVERRFQQEFAALTQDAAKFGQVVGEYDGPQGDSTFCAALADLLKREYGWNLGPDNIAVTNGSQNSFGLLFNLFAGKFDDGSFRKILFPLTPEYVGYSDVGLADESIFESLRPTIELLPDRQFKYHVDFSQIALDDRYGAVCVSRPTNPTGNVITDEELEELASRCKAANLPLIIDGAYGVPFPAMIFSEATPRWDEGIVLCLSLSKLGLPGLRTGIVVADEDIIRMIRNSNAINCLAPGSMGPALAERLIASEALLPMSRDVIRPYYQRRVEHTLGIITEQMADIDVRVHKPEGALFVWLWFEGLPEGSDALYKQLAEQGVFIIPGHHFFPGLDAEWRHRHECIRVNYGAPEAMLERGLGTIAETVRGLY